MDGREIGEGDDKGKLSGCLLCDVQGHKTKSKSQHLHDMLQSVHLVQPVKMNPRVSDLRSC